MLTTNKENKKFMSRISLILMATLAVALPAVAQTDSGKTDPWKIDPQHTSAQFAVRHLGVSTVRGAFTKVTGSATYDSDHPAKTTLEATIDAASVDTRVQDRDNDLRSPNYLDVEKYPTITFHSRQTVADKGKLKITGDLTIHGITKEVVLDVDGPTQDIKDPMGHRRMGATASVKINRHDFGVNGGGKIVGDELTITIDVELIQAAK
jgi:polyisoprenoid-binding protein YceI